MMLAELQGYGVSKAANGDRDLVGVKATPLVSDEVPLTPPVTVALQPGEQQPHAGPRSENPNRRSNHLAPQKKVPSVRRKPTAKLA